MLGCRVPGYACIDNVIHAIAGPGLRAECAAYMDSRGGRPEETGRVLLGEPDSRLLRELQKILEHCMACGKCYVI